MSRDKLSIIGSGNVGATCAHWAAQKEFADVVMLDIVDGLAQGKALDLYEATPVGRYDVRVQGTCDYAGTANSDVVIITSGLARKPGMSRDDLIKANTQIVSQVTRSVVQYSPNAILIVVSNPLDAMTYVAGKVSGLPKNQVLGMAGVLDAARYRAFIAEALNISVADISAMLLGGHGDDMVPLPRYTTIAGIPLTEWLDAAAIDKIVTRTRNGGIEIVNLLKTASAYYAPSISAVDMAEAILKDKRRVMPCCAWCDREYNAGGSFVGVPVILGRKGAEKVVELQLNSAEMALFRESLSHVQKLTATVDQMLA